MDWELLRNASQLQYTVIKKTHFHQNLSYKVLSPLQRFTNLYSGRFQTLFPIDLQALERGVHFEICYAPAIRDAVQRRSVFRNAMSLVSACKGRNIIVSSGSQHVTKQIHFSTSSIFIYNVTKVGTIVQSVRP